MRKLTVAELNRIRREKHIHIVLMAGLLLSVSAVFFGLEFLGLATGLGVVGTIVMCIADI